MAAVRERRTRRVREMAARWKGRRRGITVDMGASSLPRQGSIAGVGNKGENVAWWGNGLKPLTGVTCGRGSEERERVIWGS